MRILVTGGAGYIGSHAVAHLLRADHQVIVVDNFCRGHREAVPTDVTCHELDIRDTSRLGEVMRSQGVEAVMHFAALAYVGESVEQPLRYYHNNTAGTISLLQAMEAAGVKRMVFSSTCATYGIPEDLPIREETPQSPINPYGHSKLMVERILHDVAASDGDFAVAMLRYFNVAGAARDGTLGEDHDPESHLIPSILLAALGRRETIRVFGDDYSTPDGTCIRDYIHVEDLVEAHALVLESLQPGEKKTYNLGMGRGFSVHEVIEAARRVTQRDIPVELTERRAGDPPMLYADATKILGELGWQAQTKSIDEIVDTAWQWFRSHPEGY